MLSKLTRQAIKYIITGSKGLVLQNLSPNLDRIKVEKVGLYLHIPFCRSPCFYCPYFKEKYNKEKAQKKHKLAKPSFSTRSDVHQDIKNMMRKDGSDEHGSKDYVNYRKKLDRDADRTYSRENRKAKKRRKKKMKKEEKQKQRQATNMGEQST